MGTQKFSFSHARDKTKSTFLEKLLFSHQFSRSRTEKGHGYFLKDFYAVLIFKLTLLCQESFCFTNIRSARYVDNTGTENQCQYEFPHFPAPLPTYDGSPLILIFYDLSFRFTQNGIICRLPVFRLLSDENIMEGNVTDATRLHGIF